MRKSRLAPLLLVATLLAGAAVVLTTLGHDDATPPPIDVPAKPRTPRPKPRPAVDEALEP
ncbi:MAG: hypothetical protein IT459_21680, partial [Planctomycetes bacterium]|nr:hypothetical protein [Planctomycetota bacterium]